LIDCGSRSCRVLGRLASRTRQSGIVNLLILQTLARQGNVAEVFAGYGPVVVDECRHLPAVALERSVRAAISTAGSVSAPPDGCEVLRQMRLGPARHTMSDDAATVLNRWALVIYDTSATPTCPVTPGLRPLSVWSPQVVNMTLSRRGDYVVRSAVALARAYDSGEPRKVRQVVAEMGVPQTFAPQILAGPRPGRPGDVEGWQGRRLPALPGPR
jgi:hypothetical protein